MNQETKRKQTLPQSGRGILSLGKVSIMTILLVLFSFSSSVQAQMMHGWWRDSNYRSPGLAAVLSLQPMPIDLGNFYVDNWRKGILYTALETAVFIPAMALINDNFRWHFHQEEETGDQDSWSISERNTFYGLLGSYLIIKVFSAFEAGAEAERFNKRALLSFSTSINQSPGIELSFYLRAKQGKRR